MAEYLIQDTTLTGIADAIRGKTGETGTIPVPDMASKIDSIKTGGGSAGGVSPKAVNFYDYDGTVLHAYTKEEFLALTEMPPLPEREGLICQEWNWSFEAMQDYTSKYGVCNAGATYTTDDGKTRIYITLQEGRTSPVLGVCPKGTVTVDWGDGTEPDVLTGTSTSTVVYAPNHNYAQPGNYVIRLTVNGEFCVFGDSDGSSLLRASTSSSDKRCYSYQSAIDKIELGSGVTSINRYALCNCYGLSSITIPKGITSIDNYTFYNCYSLYFVTFPLGVTKIGNGAFNNGYSLYSAAIPEGVTSIGDSVFYNGYSLYSVTIPEGVTSIGSSTFNNCYSLSSVAIPKGVTSIGIRAFNNGHSLSSVTIPKGVTSIRDNTFNNGYGLAVCDFSSHTAVPTLSAANAFTNTPADCQIRVPAALYDEWIAATNWSTYASKIVAV